MPSIEQVAVLSTPKILVDGRVVKVVPNSVKMQIPGEAKPRGMSAGGGAIEIVVGVDASTLMSKVSFSVAATAENVEMIRGWKDKTLNYEASTVQIVHRGNQYPYEQMYMSNAPDVAMEAEGSIDVEWMGKYVG